MTTPAGEAARLVALARYAILDTEPEAAFDDLARLAARVCRTPIALVSFVDDARQWFKARVGLEMAEITRDGSFCAHAIREKRLLVVPDAAADVRFAHNPLVTGEPMIRFYAGYPLVDSDGHALGTLCVIDRVPRELSPEQAEALEGLGRQAVAQLELRKALADARRARAEARDSQAHLAAVLDAATDAMMTIDPCGTILECNATCERVLAYPRAEVIGRSLAQLITPPESSVGHDDDIARHLASCRGSAFDQRVDCVVMRKEGETFPAELFVTAIRSGGPAAFVVQLRDTSTRDRSTEASRRLAAIVESSDDAIVAKDLNGVITSWNGAAERIFGYTAAEAVGQSITMLIPPDRQHEESYILAKFRRGERVDHFESVRLAKDGRAIDVSLTISPLYNAAGRVVGASKIARDITERKRSEEALKRSEADARRLALVASRTDNAVIITDAQGRIEWVNDGFVRITEYTLDEVVGRRPASFLQGPATDQETVRRIRARLAAGEGFAEEIVNYSKSGREYWLAMDVQPIHDEAGTLTNFIAIESDITPRKRAEAELRRAHDELESRVRQRTAELAAKAESLRRAEEDYRGIFEDAVEGIYQIAPRGGFLRANPALARMYGYTSPEALIANMNDVGRQLYVDPGRREEFRRIVDEYGSVSGFESQVRREDGRVIWISENARAVRDANGAVIRYEGFVADITDRRRAEAEIRALNAELASAYDATIEGWARALDLRDKETEGHTRRVTEMSLRLAKAMGIEGEALVHVRRGALLHDIGKLGVPDGILLKVGALTEEEWEIMRRHPANARDWLEAIPVLRPALEIPYCHHERWDGTGYPQGLAGDAIPLAARLFAAVDIWDALRSDRPYRAAWPDERVRAYLQSLAGTHLDPAVVAVFLGILDDSTRDRGLGTASPPPARGRIETDPVSVTGSSGSGQPQGPRRRARPRRGPRRASCRG